MSCLLRTHHLLWPAAHQTRCKNCFTGHLSTTQPFFLACAVAAANTTVAVRCYAAVRTPFCQHHPVPTIHSNATSMTAAATSTLIANATSVQYCDDKGQVPSLPLSQTLTNFSIFPCLLMNLFFSFLNEQKLLGTKWVGLALISRGI